MNNLKEVWSLFDFATSSRVLGDLRHFSKYFANPIEAARDIRADAALVQHGERKNKELREELKPYFLQRFKTDYLKDKLPPKHELVVWTHLSDEQRAMYSDFVNLFEQNGGQ